MTGALIASGIASGVLLGFWLGYETSMRLNRTDMPRTCTWGGWCRRKARHPRAPGIALCDHHMRVLLRFKALDATEAP